MEISKIVFKDNLKNKLQVHTAFEHYWTLQSSESVLHDHGGRYTAWDEQVLIAVDPSHASDLDTPAKSGQYGKDDFRSAFCLMTL